MSRQEFFDEAFSVLLEKKPAARGVKGLVVNHHLLAAPLMAQAISYVATDEPITVVLLSPNHFFAGAGQIISSLYDWQTPFGVLSSDQKFITKLRLEGLAEVEESPFVREHGIANLVGFIKKALPQAKIVPVIVKDTLSDRQGETFAEFLVQNLPADALVIASLDFSHYLASDEADREDAKTIAILNALDYGGVKSLNYQNEPRNVDSKPALMIFLKYLSLGGADKFEIISHSSSAKLTGQDGLPETTSYINGFFWRWKPLKK